MQGSQGQGKALQARRSRWAISFHYPKRREVLAIHYRIAGVGETLTIGLYPEISLEDARDKLAKARKLVAKGQSPAAAWGMGDSCGADENAQAAHCSFVEPGGGVF